MGLEVRQEWLAGFQIKKSLDNQTEERILSPMDTRCRERILTRGGQSLIWVLFSYLDQGWNPGNLQW